MQKDEFIKQYYPLAKNAGIKYHINPTVILAQAAQESGWGSSFSARNRNNFFGVTKGNGKSNEFWAGTASPSSTNPKLLFRVYATPMDSFYDFARIISSYYPNEALLSPDSTAYARAIAQSRYISETNGDNRSVYQQNIVSNSSYIDKILPKLKDTGVGLASILLVGGIYYLFSR